MDQNAETHAGCFASLERDTSSGLDRTPESISSFPCASRNVDSTGSPSRIYDNSCLGDPAMPKQHATPCLTFYTNAKHGSAVGFSLGYEPLLRGLLSLNIVEVRQGFLVLRSWNDDIREIHDTEQFDSLFSVLCHEKDAHIPRSRLCEMCAIAATSSQFVRHLLAPGLINYWYGKLPLGVLVSRMGPV